MPDMPVIWTSVTTTSAGSVRRCSRHCCAELTESTSNPRLRRLSRRRTAVSSSSSTIRMVPFTARSYLSAAYESRHPWGPRGHLYDGPATRHEANERQDQRDYEDDLCDAGRTSCEAEEAEHRCDQCNDEECNCPGKHESLLWLCIRDVQRICQMDAGSEALVERLDQGS